MRNIENIKKLTDCWGKYQEYIGKYVVLWFNDGHITKRRMYKIDDDKYATYYNKQQIVFSKNATGNYEIVEKKAIAYEPANKPSNNSSYIKVKNNNEKLILECIKNDIPVFLTGPAGCGKNFIVQKAAKALGLDFYFTNSVQQEYKLTGFIDAGGTYHETEFYKAFKNGGLFFLDEIDASIPEVLVLLNAAIANRYFEFPNGRINANDNFRVVAAGNTIGLGADELYTGRFQLDEATLDRFAMIALDYERTVEMEITNGNDELVDFIRAIRKEAKKQGMHAVFSYRCLINMTRLENVIGTYDAMKMLIFKGMSQDEINTLKIDGPSKYYKCLNEMRVQ